MCGPKCGLPLPSDRSISSRSNGPTPQAITRSNGMPLSYIPNRADRLLYRPFHATSPLRERLPGR
jgi:hypothetical protein